MPLFQCQRKTNYENTGSMKQNLFILNQAPIVLIKRVYFFNIINRGDT